MTDSSNFVCSELKVLNTCRYSFFNSSAKSLSSSSLSNTEFSNMRGGREKVISLNNIEYGTRYTREFVVSKTVTVLLFFLTIFPLTPFPPIGKKTLSPMVSSFFSIKIESSLFLFYLKFRMLFIFVD